MTRTGSRALENNSAPSCSASPASTTAVRHAAATAGTRNPDAHVRSRAADASSEEVICILYVMDELTLVDPLVPVEVAPLQNAVVKPLQRCSGWALVANS